MSQVTLNEAIARLSSDKLKERTEALENLKHILQQNKRSPKLDALNDKACHKIFEALFRCVSIEKSIFNRSSRSSTRGQSTSRLPLCASVLRIAVEASLRNLRTKSVHAVIDHIIQTIKEPGEGLWEVLSNDYMKCLRSLLEYPPHVEHLGESEWLDTVNFCLRCLSLIENEGNQLSIRTSHHSSSEALDVSSSRSTPVRMLSGRTATSASSHVDKGIVEEVVVCIQLLTASANAPVQEIAGRTLNGLSEYLASSTQAGNAHQAFKAINAVLMKVMCDQCSLVRDFILEIIPVIRRLWTTKLSGLKDEILITIMLCMDLLRNSAQFSSAESTIESLEGLVDVLLSEYVKRPEREVLQIDDLVFYQSPCPERDWQIFGPRLGNPRSEHNWTVVWAIACLLAILDDISGRSTAVSAVDDMPNKKPRLLSRIDDIVRDCISSSGTRKACALQLLSFLEHRISIESKAFLLERLTVSIMDDNASVASWTLLAISSIASAKDARSHLLKPYWQQIWDLASRASVSQVTSRAACILMETLLRFELLDYSEVTETIRSMLSAVDLNGPSVLCDSSLMLWARIIKMRLHTASGLGLDASKQICNWLRGVWTIGTISDRIQAAQIALFARPVNILDLLLSCTNRSTSPRSVQFRGPAGPISRAWFRHHQNRDLTEYLFTFDDHSVLKAIWHAEETFLSLEPPFRSDPNDGIVTELLQAKTDAFSQAWRALREEKLHHITGDVVQILASSCVVTAIFIECLPQPHGARVQELRKSSRRLWREICEYVSSGEDTTVQACLDILSPIISSAPCLKDPDDPVSRALDDLASPLIKTLEERRHSQGSESFPLEPEAMDLDDALSIRNETTVQDSVIGLNRECVPIFSDIIAFQRCLTIQLSIFHLGGAHVSENGDSAQTSLISYLRTFNETDVLSAQNFLPKVFSDTSELTRTNVLDVLEHFAETCLQSYRLERCEGAQCLCIYLMTCFVDFWTTEESDDLHDSASDLYAWFIQVLVEKRKASPRVLIALTELLERVINSNPAYSMAEDGPSSRTSLFYILQEGDMSVKFSVAKLIPNIFGRFLLRDHEAIFNDVLESLPKDPDWNEGIALRLYALAQLASRWHTLLRRSIYHIFETPGQVPESARYARKCLRDVSNALKLRDAKEIFQLFSPQILYTWTETQSITSMPFTIFGYSSLKEMLIDAQDELVGQIMMRANDQDAIELSKCLGSPFADLLAESFHKAEAYTIARDISIPPSQDSQPKGVESRIKKQLGTDQFVRLVEIKFPETVATLFKSLCQEEQIERAFAKRSNFRFAADNLRRITEKSASSALLPASQQPSFRARYLLDELEFLCKRAGYDLETMWTPALVSFVCRTLLESIQPALGSLYACSVLRKIRILVCLAGPVIVQDYPLEQLLHALRPFLTDFHCSEDALGLFWYLLEAGKPYLIEHPGFVAGIAVSTLVSLRDFLTSLPESTTQESQFRTVLSKSQEFREWLGDFLENYRPSNLSDDVEQSFRRMIRSSQKCSTAGNAVKGTYESELLLELLQDRSSGRNLLNGSVSDLVLSLLCRGFQMPSDLHNDVLGGDEDAAKSTVAVWQTIQNGISEKEYRLWAARVIGRAYAATGQISEQLLREQDTELFKAPVRITDPFLASKVTILHILCGILFNSNRSYLGLVERTLQLIVSKIASYPELEHCEQAIPPSLLKALVWTPYHCPDIRLSFSEVSNSASWPSWDPKLSAAEWARDLALSLAVAAANDPVIGPLRKILYTVPDLATRLLPYILHDVLLSEIEGDQTSRQKVSEVFGEVLQNVEETTVPHAQIVINTILYLRNQPKPHETTIVERDDWLDVDYSQAASAASRCRMHKTALLFIEIQASRAASGNRRSSMVKYSPPPGLLHDIFRAIGDPDLFYGIQQDATLESVMEKLDYESAGYKNLLFQSAQYDSDVRLKGNGNTYGIIKALNATNLQGVASAMLSAPSNSEGRTASLDSLLSTAMSLQQWDIPVPPSHPSATGVLFKAFQNLNTSGDKDEVLIFNNECFLEILDRLTDKNRSVTSLRDSMRALGLLSEVDDVLRSTSSEQIEQMWERMTSRKAWLQAESFQDIAPILFCRETLFSSIKNKDYLKSSTKLTSRNAQLLEVKAIRESFKISRDLDGSQESLKSAISLSKLVQPCAALGINIDGAAKFDLANVLWDQGEMTTSIRMLQQLNEKNDLHKQALVVSRAEVLASLGHHVAEARLEKPETIIQEYLVPAVKELKGNSEGEEAGRVFHRFAMFCDQQLQNPESLEDFQRVEQLRDRKEKEVLALEKMMEAAEGKEKESLKMHRTKAKQWFDLDDREYQRLKRSREAFLQQCLENYLLCLKACDTYNNDALRFCALWLDKSGDPKANHAVSKFIEQVPSRKFAPLMNQLSSRLLDVADDFQALLSALIFRICVEHPYHGMYQIFASSKSRGGKDQTSLSRYQAAGKLVEKLRNDRHAGPTWVAIHNTNISYVRFAADRLEEKVKSGAKVPLRKLATGQRLEQDATSQRLPPPTMRIELRVDCNYSDVPKVVKFSPEFTVASGVSAPKIVTVLATDGLRYKQLVKGGNDDLRQDAIMEQVFEQVSNLLKDHRATRQRNLGIRTYKVLPLTSNAGIIEFVQNTIPLHDYLMPAHQRYFPKDMKPNVCRKHISDVQTRSVEQRIRTFRQVTDHFHPVMRFFFMEKFNNPDDWFSKRLAYTRSTAAISILGHVLGLGDRHGHNILLDEKTGEVVHIDLGVAFEQGRVLPVPEVVPFRLTRDLVDGMGITKTEGVFRRCCEFTLEALREESYSIMTILDVLRYDPLYSWTVSPLRMKRMQEDQEAGDGPPVLNGMGGKSNANEPSEADRALTVVAKKLSKTLSVTATVNELIQQATDERNLALLYCGWAAYA
ncbi:hypothetical protein VTN77DRAFT_3810 [Rasamsonia byssochlamydoides]|uniref:uncharacterized protein n=1 Tax=Rasamsonia byssochlamydoides TaxID=89139 RepID=UPI0037433234